MRGLHTKSAKNMQKNVQKISDDSDEYQTNEKK